MSVVTCGFTAAKQIGNPHLRIALSNRESGLYGWFEKHYNTIVSGGVADMSVGNGRIRRGDVNEFANDHQFFRVGHLVARGPISMIEGCDTRLQFTARNDEQAKVISSHCQHNSYAYRRDNLRFDILDRGEQRRREAKRSA